MVDLSVPARADLAGAGADGAQVPHLSCHALDKRYGATRVLESLDFAVARGELVSLLGPSGCGKTTLLRLVAGLVRADAGRIVLGGRELTRVPAHKRNISVVFQNYALFPHLSVAENVGFGLKARGLDARARTAKVDEVLAMVQMSAFAARPIGALSGGQQQRVAVARALAVDPDLLLLDEPFSALDRKLRESMQIELKALLRRRGMTAIFVTHDQDEALAVSDRIAVMHAGRIEHFSDPTSLYARPATLFALEFVGLSTRLHGTVAAVEGATLVVDTAWGRLRAPGSFRTGAAVVLAVRPERIVPCAPGLPPDADHNVLTCPVADALVLGSRTHVYGSAGGGDHLLCESSTGSAALLPAAGASTGFRWAVDDTLVYPSDRS